ncbi:MAG: FHA domain-containing protein [Nannocystales bacterium]
MESNSDTLVSCTEITALAREARSRTQLQFAEGFPVLFLLARPDTDVDEFGEDDMDFDTVAVPAGGSDEQAVQEWFALPLTWPTNTDTGGRLSIGRANGCDLVVRRSFISKMHAFVQRGPGDKLCVGDHRSANGTWVNGQRVRPNQRLALELGDQVKLGILTFRLVDAEHVHRALTSVAFATWEVAAAKANGD